MKESIIRFFKTLLNLVRYIVSACIVVLIFGLSYQILSNTYINKEIGNDGSSFHNLPENTIDVLVLGSSHAQYSFCPAFFYEDTGLYSYVLGTGGQPLEMSYEMLKEGLKTQSPKLVILEVFTAMPLRTNAEADYNYISPLYQMTGQEKYNAINYLPEDKRKQYLNEFITTHNNWKEDWIDINRIKESVVKIKNDYEGIKVMDTSKIDYSMGYIVNYPTYPVENCWYPYNTHDYLDVTLDELDQISLDNIYNLCQEKGIELLLYKTPIDSLDQENISYLHKVWEWADNKNIICADFIELAPELDFNMCIQSDSYHSFLNGASIITSYLADIVNRKEYNFNHIENELLTELNKKQSSFLTSEYLNYEYDPKKYLVRMRNYSNLLLIRYNAGIKSETITRFLSRYGIDPDNNFYGIFDDGKLIAYDNNELCFDYIDHNYVINRYNSIIDGGIIEDNGGELNFVIYDKYNYWFKIKSTNISAMWGWNEPYYVNE